MEENKSKFTFAVIGLGYVGLRVAVALGQSKQNVIGYDINEIRINELRNAFDRNLDIPVEQLQSETIQFTTDHNQLKTANFYIVDIETPVDDYYIPDMSALKSVCNVLGSVLKRNDIVVFESTVYPGATEEILVPILEEKSGLKSGKDFLVGNSPERIVPGDLKHGLTNTPKIIAGQNEEALQKIKEGYEYIVKAELVSVSSIKMAEAIKMLENIQRDVNIALMNEYAEVMDKMGLNMKELINAASSKWNFLPFKPGLVGGHCIPVDPYYLIYKARHLKLEPRLISTARDINEKFVNFVFEVAIGKLIKNGGVIKDAPIAIFGMSFKENVADTRNSITITLYKKFKELGINVLAFDPLAHFKHAREDINMVAWEQLEKQKMIIITVAHNEFQYLGLKNITEKLDDNSVLIDVPGMFYQQPLPRNDIEYWNL